MRKLLVPEVVQTSSLDCGPACLKAFLEGFGRRISYDTLREACQTGLDGTSIDTIEVIAKEFGLQAEQIMLPLDHLLMAEARALPAIVVVTLSQGITHFVVVWRRYGGWLQIMDPSVGRRWVRCETFLKDVYQHSITANTEDWLEFSQSDEFQRVLEARQRRIGIKLTSEGTIGARDAAIRLTQSMVASGAVARNGDAQKLAQHFAKRPEAIPRRYWSVAQGEASEVVVRGAVLVRAAGTQSIPERSGGDRANTSWRMLLQSGGFIWTVLAIGLVTASAGAFLEALLFRGLMDVTANLGIAGQRMGAMAAVLLFCSAMLLLELPAFTAGARFGRVLETRFRVAFLEKLPRLSERYFQTRPISDSAERSHIMHRLRHLPDQIRQFLVAALQLLITAAGVIWLDAGAWPLMLATLFASLIPVFSSHWLLRERDLRVRTHSGGLMRFYLDAMLGLMPIRTHGAGASLRRQHNSLLSEWTNASFRLQSAVVWAEGLQLLVMFGVAAALLLRHPFSSSETGRILLEAYWVLSMPALGQQIATLARQYPNYRSILLRLLEPLGAPEEKLSPAKVLLEAPAIEFRNLGVVASGNNILADVCLRVDAGSHVAIVGTSGAGKSTLVGMLLGRMKAASGEILVNGEPLDVEQIRISSAWVDPAVQLWKRSLHSNLTYGADSETELAEVVDAAALRGVLESLPQGLQTNLGENGGLVSGGEGQRVRFGRALQRRDAKLVILDEPFRGLDREKRRELLVRARDYWSGATLLCVTHDLSETLSFERVAVIEHGRLVEHGSPQKLAGTDSRYSQLLAAEEQARGEFWQMSEWRRMRLCSGQIVEEMPEPAPAQTFQSELA